MDFFRSIMSFGQCTFGVPLSALLPDSHKGKAKYLPDLEKEAEGSVIIVVAFVTDRGLH